MSLRRTPARLSRFLARNQPCALEFQVFDAVDGEQLDEAGLIRDGLLEEGARFYTRGAIGNALSHRALWLQTKDSGRPAMVFEDDAHIRRDIRSLLPGLVAGLPSGWDILFLGFNTDYPLDLRIVPGLDMRLNATVAYPDPARLDEYAGTAGAVGAARVNNLYGTCAYLVSARGAARLAQLCFPLDNRRFEYPSADPESRRTGLTNSFDGILITLYRKLNAFVCVPPLALASNSPSGSTTKPPTGPG